MKRRRAQVLRHLDRMAEPLWVGGVMAVLILPVLLVTGTQSAVLWSGLIVLGTGLPLLLIGAAMLGGGSSAAAWLRLVLAVIAVAALVPLVLRGSWIVIVLAVLHLLIAGFAGGAFSAAEQPWSAWRQRILRRAKWLPLALVVSAVSWSAALQLVSWTDPQSFILHSPYSVTVLIAVLVMVTVTIHRRVRETAPPSRIRSLAATAVGAALLVTAGLRVDGVLGFGGFIHSSFYVGPAELVRQGHWLLWDVPSQYGFLSALVIALVPTKASWQSLFLLNAGLTAASAIVLFLVLRSLGRGVLNFIFSLSIVVTAQFLRAGGIPRFDGPEVFPSVGGLRFFWVIALMAILLRLLHLGEGGKHRNWYVLGCSVWLIGVLWSVESAIYCSATWLPASLILEMRSPRRAAGSNLPRWWRVPGPWVLLPGALLAGAALLIIAYYQLRLGHVPDLSAFVEYGRAYGSGTIAPVRLDPWGAVWVLLVVFWSLVAVATKLLRRSARVNAVMWGACAGPWSTATYFVARPHPNNVMNLAPILVMSIAMMITVLRLCPPVGGWAGLVRAAWVPVLTMLLVCTVGSATPTRNYLLSIFSTQPGRDDVTRLLPVMPPQAQALLLSAHIRSDDPVAFLSCDELSGMMPVWRGSDGPVVYTPRAWTALYPALDLYPLPEARREEYVARFKAATPSGGWLVECLPAPAFLSWAHGALERTYRPQEVFNDGPWRATHYVAR